MTLYNVRRIRQNSEQIYVYNSAGTIYLYDEANRTAIVEANPSILHSYYGLPEKDVDTPLLALGEKGMLVVFELYQDDELQAELCLGSPLSKSEMGKIPWSNPQTAFLSLPSGILWVESMDSLSLGTEETDEVGYQVTVSPGEYCLSLQCLSPQYDQDPAALLPEYFIALQPISSSDRPVNQPFLSYPRQV